MSETYFKGETAKPFNAAVNDAPIETFPRLASGNLERVEHIRWGGHPLVCLVIDGVEWFICQQVGEAFGYPDPKSLQQSINNKWRQKFLKQERAVVVEGNLLNQIKQNLVTNLSRVGDVESPTSPVNPYAPRILLLTENGINRAATLSDAPLAEEFCDWVCGELLPTLRRTGSYHLGEPEQEGPASAILISAQKERRLLSERDMQWLHQAFDAGALTRAEFAQAVRDLLRGTLKVCRHLPTRAPIQTAGSPQLRLC